MAVSVKILNKVIDENNSEYNAAVALKTMLENSFSSETNGSIGIAYGLTTTFPIGCTIHSLV